MKKIIIISILLLIPSVVSADYLHPFKAEIIEISPEKINIIDTMEGNMCTVMRNIEVLSLENFKIGDRVIAQMIETENDYTECIITGFARSNQIYFLAVIFALIVLIINKKTGSRLLVNLVVTFAIIFFAIIPLILKGWSPVFVTVAGGSIAMLWSIYFSHGINKKSHAAIIGIIASLAVVGLISSLFIDITSLTGFADEEAGVIIALGHSTINMRGLLLAAIIVGALGVLDDLAISQVSSVQELLAANPNFTRSELMKSAFRIGRDHTGAIVNTLALAYVGASFPLIILMTLREPPFDSIASVLNNEVVATEIVRTLVGSIGILLSMPICTWVAILIFTKSK